MYRFKILVLFFLSVEVCFLSVVCMVCLLFSVFFMFRLCVILWNMVLVKNVLNVMCLCCFGVISMLVIGVRIWLNFVCIVFFSCNW